MSHPRIDRLRGKHPVSSGEVPGAEADPAEVANPKLAKERAISERFRQTVPAEQLLDLPVVSAAAIIEQAREYPLAAAYSCRKGFYLLESGRQRQLRHYIAAAYAITCSIRDSEQHLKSFAGHVSDARSRTPPSVDKVRSNLLQHVFRYIFAESGAATRNRAYQYAYGLQDCYNLGKTVDEVGARVVRYGPEKLYRAATKRAHLIEAAKEFAASGRQPATITEDEILAEEASKPSEEDYGEFVSRELPPDDDDWVSEVDAALHEPMPSDDMDEADDGLVEPSDEVNEGDDDDSNYYPGGFDDDDDEREDLLAAESRLALLTRMVHDLEAGLNELRIMIRSL